MNVKLSDFQDRNDIAIKRTELSEEYNKIVDKVTEEKRDISEEEQKRLDEIIVSKRSLEGFDKIFIQKEENMRSQASKNPGKKSPAEKETEEIRKFSFMRIIQSKIQERNLDGLEAEMHQEADKEFRESNIGSSLQGVGIPSIVFRSMTATGETSTAGDQGGNWIPTEKQGLMLALRPRLVMAQLGAQFISGLSGNIDFPKGGAVTGGWKAETADANDGTPTTSVVSMNPNRLPVILKYSRQLMLQSSPDVERFLLDDLFRYIAEAVDQGAINGRGTATHFEPLGVLSTSGIGSVPIGTDGGAPTWAHITALETKVAENNGDVGSMAYLTNAKVRGKLKNTLKASGVFGFVWEGGSEPLNGYPAAVTNLVPSDLAKGGGSDLSAILFGNFNDMVIGNWGGMDIVIDPYTAKKAGQIEIGANTYWDAKVLRPESFAAIVDATTT